MKNFKYISATSIEDAISILEEYQDKAWVMAGGTDLLGQMKDSILSDYPEIIVNIKTISDLDYVREDNNTLRIGALTRLEDISRNDIIKRNYTILAEAAGMAASPHIRETGTIGGNICQSNRCWYYWVPDNRFYCLRKGGKTCPAYTGDSRYHSIFGSTRINSTPCSTNCPANINIPEYMSKIRENNLYEAAKILLISNPFPAITGRVCPHTCENECNRADFDEAISIRSVERFLGDYIFKNVSEMFKPPQNETGKNITIIGSGPAGLSAAYFLRSLGHNVTIYDAMEEAGGILTYGIPPYRLPKDIVKNQIMFLENIGINFRLNTEIGKNIELEELMNDFDIVLLACGAGKERLLEIKGEELIVSGREFLININLSNRENPGEKVAVIGGGNSAMDVARTLIRLGVKQVQAFCIESREDMPASREEIDRAEQEGIEIRFRTMPVEVFEQNGQLSFTFTKIESGFLDENGKLHITPIKGSESTIEFNAIIKAIGEVPDCSIVPGDFLNELGQLKVDDSGYYLGENLFTCGDYVNGSSSVINAIASGRRAADAIDQYLGGVGLHLKADNAEIKSLPEKFDGSFLKKTGRIITPELPVSERINNIDTEDINSLDFTTVQEESNRCFNCGCVSVNFSDIAPVLIALDARITTSKRIIEAENFFSVNGDRTMVLDNDEIVTAIEIPKPGNNTRMKFIKFAIRKSIDFPVVNCAAVLDVENNIVKSGRICLNAVYNNPYRVTGAEEYIKGKSINESVAETAADTFTEDCSPLADNRYKIQIARTLVKRAILACKPD